EDGLRAAVFNLDVTPPLGSALAYGVATGESDLGLQAKGLILLGAGAPIVVGAIDWIGIGNEGHDAFREALAKGAGTTRDRVAVQALHQHDAPICDFSTERILKAHDHDAGPYEGAFHRETAGRLE